jgi:3'-phosphoadenosine 5'-phosphosulfate sulfotransferase (PAPS reductase)/FAD synthetase
MLSGGRDSTAMTFYLLENKMPLDYIIFTDTESEFLEMYEYIKKVNDRLKSYGYSIITLHHKRGETFEDWCYGKIKKGKRKDMIRGLPMVTQPCYWKRESKVRPFEKFLKDNNIKEYIQYIGYTYSEKKRANVKDRNQRYPLIELKKCEADVDKKLLELDLVNPLYKNFERTGCYFCPYQKVRGFYLLWKLHPEQLAYMLKTETKLNNMDDVINPQWNIRYSMSEMQYAFENKSMLFDVESPKACECAI